MIFVGTPTQHHLGFTDSSQQVELQDTTEINKPLYFSPLKNDWEPTGLSTVQTLFVKILKSFLIPERPWPCISRSDLFQSDTCDRIWYLYTAHDIYTYMPNMCKCWRTANYGQLTRARSICYRVMYNCSVTSRLNPRFQNTVEGGGEILEQGNDGLLASVIDGARSQKVK